MIEVWNKSKGQEQNEDYYKTGEYEDIRDGKEEGDKFIKVVKDINFNDPNKAGYPH